MTKLQQPSTRSKKSARKSRDGKKKVDNDDLTVQCNNTLSPPPNTPPIPVTNKKIETRLDAMFEQEIEAS